jgi:HTH-type transcriptional regulator / antitoxin HigA
MQAVKSTPGGKLPRRFDELVALLPPRAIADDAAHDDMLAMIDRLMASGRLSKGQESYLETLVQLVEAYERKHHAIDLSGVSGVEMLRDLLDQHGMSAADLSRLLGVHASLGSKILNGDRALTIKHIRILAEHFQLNPSAFIDG